MRKGVVILVALIALSSKANASFNFITGCATLSAPVNGVQLRTCDTCAPGFVRTTDGSQCNACPLGCSLCDNLNLCQTCSDGNYLFQGACLSCGVGCKTCSGATCISCAVGFGLNNQTQCIQCAQNCANCDINGLCLSCINGYSLQNNSQGQQNCVFGTARGPSGGVITWLVVLFIACCAPFTLLCFLCFRPSYHTGEPGVGYLPLQTKLAPVIAQVPLVATTVQGVPVVTTNTQRVVTSGFEQGGQQFSALTQQSGQQFGATSPGKGNTIRYNAGY